MNQEEIMQQLQLGMQALQAGGLDVAENIFRNILSTNSSEVHSLHFLGVVFCQKGNLDDGVALIEQSIRLDTSRFGPYLNLGRFLVGASQWNRAVSVLQEAVHRDASSFDAWSMLAQAHFSARNADAALIAGQKAAEINPANAEIYFSLGVYSSEKNKDEAIDHYRNALSIDPASLKSWVNIGNCLLDCQRIKESVAAFNEALEIDPSCVQALMGLSRAYGDLSKWQESFEVAQKAFGIDPFSHDTAFWVGLSLHKLDRTHEAVNAYRAALNLTPVAAQTHLYLASALESVGEEEAAMHSYDEASSLDESDPRPFLYLAALARKRSDFILAIKKYRRAVEVDPKATNGYLDLGSTLKEFGRIDEAILNFRTALSIEPDSAYSLWELATILHEDNEMVESSELYASELLADQGLDSCRFHLYAAGIENATYIFEQMQSQMVSILQCSDDLLREDLFFLRCISDFFARRGMRLDCLVDLDQDFADFRLPLSHSPALNDLVDTYSLCRKSLLPRWLAFEVVSSFLLLLSDFLESLRVKDNSATEDWKVLKDYQLAMMSADVAGLPSEDQLFVKVEDCDELLWLLAERFQFPDMTAALTLRESLFKKSSLPAASKQDQSEFFRKAHLLDAQKFYMAEIDPCLHGVSELYRVHGLIADTISEIGVVRQVVDLGYYSCGIFNAALKAELQCYFIEPACHHAVWAAETGIAEVVPDLPERCVRSFDEYLSRLEAVALDDSGSTAAVMSFILQLFEYEQCVEILQRVKGFASHLVITDDILNEKSEESILRLLRNGKRMNLCHNYQRLLSDAGWRIEKKWYFHGVRYASGIIVACAA